MSQSKKRHKWKYEKGGCYGTCVNCGLKKEQYAGFAIYFVNGRELPRAPKCK